MQCLLSLSLTASLTILSQSAERPIWVTHPGEKLNIILPEAAEKFDISENAKMGYARLKCKLGSTTCTLEIKKVLPDLVEQPETFSIFKKEQSGAVPEIVAYVKIDRTGTTIPTKRRRK